MQFRHDNPRRSVSIAYALLIWAALLWAVFGTGVLDSQHLGQIGGGWLVRDATVMAIPITAQIPWFFIMLSLGVYAVWQATPAARATQLHVLLRPWILTLVVLNAGWLQLLQWDKIGLSLLISALMVTVLIRIVIHVGRTFMVNHTDRWITRSTLGLFLGWLLIITLGQGVAWLAFIGVNPRTMMFKGTAAFVLLMLSLALCAATFKNPMGIYLNAGALWVVSWIVIDRYSWGFSSPIFAIVATLAAGLLLLCLVSALRTRISRLLGQTPDFP